MKKLLLVLFLAVILCIAATAAADSLLAAGAGTSFAAGVGTTLVTGNTDGLIVAFGAAFCSWAFSLLRADLAATVGLF